LEQAGFMPTVDVERSKRADVLQKIADARFAYPSADHADWETVVNFPEGRLGVQIRGGGWIYPDVAVTQEPGHFIQLLAVVALRHEVTDAEALGRWLPLSKAGPLFLFVPAGQAGRANALCRQHSIRVAGIRTWRWTPTYGLDIAEAYAGPDIFSLVAAILPEALRPRGYRVQRVETVERYRSPAAGRFEALPETVQSRASEPEVAEVPVAQAELPAGVHLPSPSVYPIVLAMGMALIGFGVMFPAELLGAGLVLLVVGTLGWVWEDVVSFGASDEHGQTAAAAEPAPTVELPAGVHLPPPSVAPVVMALGGALTGFGVMFPAELLGAGLAVLSLGALKWVAEDVAQFGESGVGHA
jgi:hypothetical protein